MSVYPVELRWRVVEAYKREEGSYRELAERFMIVPSTVQEWMSLYETTGELKAQVCGRKTDPVEEGRWRERLKVLLEEQNDLTLSELVELLEKRYQQKTSTSAVDRWLKRFGITRKKRASGPANKTANESSF